MDRTDPYRIPGRLAGRDPGGGSRPSRLRPYAGHEQLCRPRRPDSRHGDGRSHEYCPSPDGLSHAPEESLRWEDLKRANLLLARPPAAGLLKHVGIETEGPAGSFPRHRRLPSSIFAAQPAGTACASAGGSFRSAVPGRWLRAFPQRFDFIDQDAPGQKPVDHPGSARWHLTERPGRDMDQMNAGLDLVDVLAAFSPRPHEALNKIGVAQSEPLHFSRRGGDLSGRTGPLTLLFFLLRRGGDSALPQFSQM